jgi:riboflavin kinase / FMN adenylyltransferase
LITPGAVQHERLAAHHIDGLVTLAFDQALSHLSPDQFIDQILRDHLQARAIVVGEDFHFGHNRSGTIDTLRAGGFTVQSPPLKRDPHGTVISSTRIRGCLAEGHINDANALLGWNWFLRGMVVHGDARGRTLGYPTANIWLHDTVAPAHGIYAAWVTRPNAARYMAAVAIGRRPMFEVSRTLCEAHLLDFSGDLYDQILDVQPVQKLRDEVRFDTLDALVAQMKKDCDLTRILLGLEQS